MVCGCRTHSEVIKLCKAVTRSTDQVTRRDEAASLPLRSPRDRGMPGPPRSTCLENTRFAGKGRQEKLPNGSSAPKIGWVGGGVIFNVPKAEIKSLNLQNNKNNINACKNIRPASPSNEN